VRQRELLKCFGSPEELKKASLEALAKTPKMNEKLAKKVYLFFRKNKK
jgi:excinuclease UvrABC nuclease subunit